MVRSSAVYNGTVFSFDVGREDMLRNVLGGSGRSNAGDDTSESEVGKETKAGDDIAGNSEVVNMPSCLSAPVYNFTGENVRLGTIFL